LIVSLSDPAIFHALRSRVGPEQIVLDLVHMPIDDRWPCKVEGLCW
jgi:hypothetical protein